MRGFFNKLLRVNLDTDSYTCQDIPDSLLEVTLGGKGLGTHLLLQENPAGVDPLSPECRFIICTGPVTGTRLWGQSRFGVYAKSPATGGYGESYSGGSLPPKIKACGFDAIVIEGKSPSPVFLVVNDEGVTFHDATEIKGKDTFETEDYILQRSPEKAGAMTIGPAGENLVACACIKVDRWRSLGRGGMGAVLGAKNIKGISFAGSQKAEIADETLLGEVVKAITANGKGSPVTKVYQQIGTPAQVRVTNSRNCFPTRYWQSGRFDAWENISGDYMLEHFDTKRHPCPNCFLACTKHSRVREGRHAGLELDRPEYETIYAIGGLNEIDSLEEIAFLNVECDRLGIDTMSAGNLSAFAIEAFKRGKTDFEIDYNQPDRTAELYRMIARREGVGSVLADGIKTAAATLDLEDIAIHVKGLEPAGFDPRVLKGMGLSYATAARGACHLRGTFYKAELSGQMAEDQIEGKAALHIDYEDRSALFDCLILCRFFRDFILWDELRDIIKATAGMDMDQRQLEIFANRVTQQTRAFNKREGLDDSQDTLPDRFIKEATREGATLSEQDLQTMLGEYNRIRSDRPT